MDMIYELWISFSRTHGNIYFTSSLLCIALQESSRVKERFRNRVFSSHGWADLILFGKALISTI